MYNKAELEKVFDKLIDVEFDLSCYIDIVTELEVYYDMECKREMSERTHFVKITLEQIGSKLKDALIELDNFLLKNK